MECIQKFLEEKNFLVTHHIESYNQFIEDIPKIIKNQNPLINFKKKIDDEFKHECRIWIGGKNAEHLQFGQPIFHENGIQKPMYPNDARLRNMTYSFSIQAKLTFEFIIDKAVQEYTTEDFVFIGYIPIMIQSSMCILHDMPPEVRFNMGECGSDPGGYFIVDGSEKVIICQEGRANNLIYTTKNYDDKYYYCADIKSESEDKSIFPRKTSVRMVTTQHGILNSDGFSLHELVVDLPDVRTPIPLFIVMRALGIISDKQIIQTCLLGEDNLQEYFRDSVCDAGSVYTQLHAIKFIGTFTKYKSFDYAMFILSTLFLPHIGTLNFTDKAYFLGFMVKKVVRLAVGIDPVTDRDSFRMKRMDTTGILLTNLFNDWYNQQLSHVQLQIDRTYNKNEQLFDSPEVFPSLFTTNYHDFFKERVTENGIKNGFKGAWGATDYTRKVGVSQKLNRLSFNSSVSHLRKCVLQIDESAKVTAPRLLHGSQWGYFDPVDTPDGGDVGTHKHLSLCTRITKNIPKQVVLDELEHLEIPIVLLEQSNVHNLSIMVKLFLNGHWIGSIDDPLLALNKLKHSRRSGRLPSSISISWNIIENILYLYTDAGRVQRPIFYIDENRDLSYDQELAADLTWNQMITGTSKHNCMVEFIDPDETNTALVTFNLEDFKKTLHTHVEIHGSTLLGFMGNQIIFPEHSPLPRNSFSCGQSKQAVSLYHTNYQNRMDTMGVVLNYGQLPLIQTSFLNSFGTLPYGINAVVAIMCYTGYNTEDAILFNRGALERGLFNTSYFKTYEMTETNDETPTVFEGSTNTDENGLVREDTMVNADTVLMRMVKGDKIKYVYPNKDQLGRVDRTFISYDSPGRRVAKVRICSERIPNIGDKFASRAGQKGTCGLIIREEDMPFTSSGIRPDLIINPHALPSRMTIGQLIESLIGKVHLVNGGIGDCTAFNTGDTKPYRDQLNKMGYHNSGNEILYNGMTGEMLESDIFIGPTYYLRLKHMVADKVNFRSRGPNTALTRQPVQGRSNEGGLRIGEMERDGVIANGMAAFVRESMMTRGDGTMIVHNTRKPYEICVDNSTGLLAVCNPHTNLYLSPTLDGMTFENDAVTTIPTYERTFTRLNVPYSFKLLMQELLTMNVQLRIITSDTLTHFEEMRYKEITQIRKCLLSLLPKELFSVKQNTLFVSNSDACDPHIRFIHTNLNPTIFPWLSTNTEFEKLRISVQSINPQPYVSLYQKERCALDIYRTDYNSLGLTLDYFLHKMKTGIFVRIKNNKVFNFLPLYNVNYRNDFYTKIDVDEFIKSLPSDSRVLKNMSKDPSTWHATNCLLRTERIDKDPTDAYLSQMYDMLVETCSHRKVNDCLFFMTRKDFPHLRKDWKESFDAIYGDNYLSDTYKDKTFIPVVAQSTSENHADFAFPTGDDWEAICPDKYFASFSYNMKAKRKEVHCKNSSTPKNIVPWEARESRAVWRGQATGCGNTETTNPRRWLHEGLNHLQLLDAGITRYTHRIKGDYNNGKLNVEYIKPSEDVVDFMSMKDQMKYKYIINVEGNSAAYRFGELLGLGFCVINIRSKYKLWFEPFLKIGKITDTFIAECDCIEIDFGEDLNKVLIWCTQNDRICKKISENGMKFYDKYFNTEFIYDYVSDMCNSISSVLHEPPNQYDEVKIKELMPKKHLSFLNITNDAVSTNTSVIIVPFRDLGDQNRTLQLEKFIQHYKNLNIVVVEQSNDNRLFNRGALLNIGYDYVTKHLPQMTAFVMHDVDILMPESIIECYYGDDGHDFVHLGLLVKSDKYNSPSFLGRVMRFSKDGYKKINGFPNTFYGWGGEDDALAHRIGTQKIYRPEESEHGIEMETDNDIFYDKLKTRREQYKNELLISDSLQWKMDGVNSLQYSIVENKSIHDCVRKITVQLSPIGQMGGIPEIAPHVLEVITGPLQTDTEVSEINQTDSIEPSSIKVVNI